MANGAKDSIGVSIVFKNFESKQRTSYMIKLALQKLEEVHWTKIERKLFYLEARALWEWSLLTGSHVPSLMLPLSQPAGADRKKKGAGQQRLPLLGGTGMGWRWQIRVLGAFKDNVPKCS